MYALGNEPKSEFVILGCCEMIKMIKMIKMINLMVSKSETSKFDIVLEETSGSRAYAMLNDARKEYFEGNYHGDGNVL
jgi:hypothetical protein